MIKVLLNGIRADGKYIPCSYSKGASTRYPAETITVYAVKYCGRLPMELNPENNSEIMTDYFETDRARILPDHPLWPEFNKRFEEKQEKNKKKYAEKYGRK